MNTQRVLYLTARELTVHRYHRRRLLESFAFSVTSEGMDGFCRYLVAEPGAPVLLLADLTEEEFRTEAMPHVARRERRQLHARHAQRLFRSAPFWSARIVGRLEAGRRDDEVMFSALTNQERVHPWLEGINSTNTPLLAISSVPHVTAPLVRTLGLGASPVLVVTEEEGAGLRQSLFVRGELRVSRLSPLPGTAAHVQWVQEEIARTQRYVQSLQFIPGGEPLKVAVVAEPGLLAELRGHTCADQQIHGFELDHVLRSCDVALPPQRYANALFAQLFARNGRNQYAQPRHLHRRNLHRLRRAITMSGLTVGSAMVLLGLSNLFQAMEYRQAIATLPPERLSLPDTGEALPLGLNADQPRDAVETAERLAALPMRPHLALSRLGAVLQHFPEFALHRLQWSASESFDEEPPAFRRPASRPDNGTRFHTVLLEGEITGPRNTEDRLHHLVNALRRSPSVAQVQIIAQPSVTAGSVGGSPRAPFALQVVLRL